MNVVDDERPTKPSNIVAALGRGPAAGAATIFDEAGFVNPVRNVLMRETA